MASLTQYILTRKECENISVRLRLSYTVTAVIAITDNGKVTVTIISDKST